MSWVEVVPLAESASRLGLKVQVASAGSSEQAIARVSCRAPRDWMVTVRGAWCSVWMVSCETLVESV
jgi:hypothetical protein